MVDRYSATHHTLYAQTLRFFGHWLNSIAVHAPEAPLLLVGTHKDELEDEHAALGQAQEILTEFLNEIPLPAVLKRIRQPSNGRWFFAVDNKSRETTAGGGVRTSDRSVGEIRSTLENIVVNDDRQVQGLSFAERLATFVCNTAQYVHTLDCIFWTNIRCVTQAWMASKVRM